MSTFAHETVLDLEYDDESLARIVERSVALEVGEIDDERSTTTVERDGSIVSFIVQARDLTALRAATNTWLRLAIVAERTSDNVDATET